MKKLLSLALAVMMLLCACAFAEETVPALEKDVVILFTSDVHCGIDQGFTYVGLAGIRDTLAKENHVILVDDGDSIQGESIGAITKGEADINLMNALGYGVATMGNHEFDYGMDRFFEIVNEKAAFPYVSCNFTYKGELEFDPYVIKEFDGIKVAFVGVTTPDTFTSSTPTFFQDEEGNYVYGFCEGNNGENLYAAVQSAADAARAEGADYVVCIAHLGIAEESKPYTSLEVIANTTGIDVVLDGHSHSLIAQKEVANKNGDTVLLSGCGTKLQAIGYCRIAVDGTLSTGLYEWKYDVTPQQLFGLENEFTAVMDNETAEANALLAKVVAHTDVDLIITDPDSGERMIRKRETNLGDLVADAYRDATGADIAMVNGGGIRANIAAGDITLNQIKSCHPFGNALCMVEANGRQILDALEWTSRNVPGENGGFLQVSGITYEIHTYIESSVAEDDHGSFAGVNGEYRVKNVMVNGEPLDLTKTYTVASHNFLLKSGGDGTNCFMGDPVLLDEIKYDYETVIDYIVETLNGTVGEDYADIWGQGRIVIVDEAK